MTKPTLPILESRNDQGQAARPSGFGRFRRRAPALLLLVLLLGPALLNSAEDIRFPADGILADAKECGAKGDGVTDDTAALIATFAKGGGKMGIIYIPAGTYLVSGPLFGSGAFLRWTYIQGAGRDRTIIKLKDNCPGYQDPKNPLWLVSALPDTAPCPCFSGKDKGCNIAFDIQINDLTLDTGSGNPGAIGMHYLCSNTGGIKNLTIRSGDGQGVTGLDMHHYGQGPCLVKGVIISGFDCGLWTKRERYQNTFEDIRLENQRVVGLRNEGLPITIRKLVSKNKVQAISNGNSGEWIGQLVLIDSELGGGDPEQVAISNDGSLFLRNVTISGYKAAVDNKGTQVPGPLVKEWFSDEWQTLFPSAKRSLGLPIKDTPEFPYEPLSAWESVRAHEDKVVGDDWGPAIQAAIDAGKTTVYFPKNSGRKDAKGKEDWSYPIRSTVIVRGAVRVIQGCGAELRVDEKALAGQPGFRIEKGVPDTVFFEKFSWPGSRRTSPSIVHAARTLVMQQCRWQVVNNAAGCGDLFVDSWGGTGTFSVPQKVFVRSLNMESGGNEPKLVNAAADLWVLGLKTEGDATNIHNLAAGKVEVLGGLIYPAGGKPGARPGFINEGGACSLIVCTMWANKPAVRDTVSGVSKDLPDAGRLWNYVYLPGSAK